MPTGGGMGGYVYPFGDGTSIACIDGNTFCGAGSVVMADAAFLHYGAGIGVNLNETVGSTTEGTYTPTGTAGVVYALTNLPASPATVRLIIGNGDQPGGTDYCTAISTATGTVPWSSFSPRCYNLPGGDAGAPLGGPPLATHVQFQINSSATGPSTFNFCVTQLKFM